MYIYHREIPLSFLELYLISCYSHYQSVLFITSIIYITKLQLLFVCSFICLSVCLSVCPLLGKAEMEC